MLSGNCVEEDAKHGFLAVTGVGKEKLHLDSILDIGMAVDVEEGVIFSKVEVTSLNNVLKEFRKELCSDTIF